MSHAYYEVKWNPERSKWEVKEARNPTAFQAVYGDSYFVLDRYRKKSPAKKQARKLAKKDNKSVAFYSKDEPGRERVTYQNDYGR